MAGLLKRRRRRLRLKGNTIFVGAVLLGLELELLEESEGNEERVEVQLGGFLLVQEDVDLLDFLVVQVVPAGCR